MGDEIVCDSEGGIVPPPQNPTALVHMMAPVFFFPKIFNLNSNFHAKIT